MMIDVQITDTIRLHGIGLVLTIQASEVLEAFSSRIIFYGNVAPGTKSCPNPDCQGGWLPDIMADGRHKCPVCKTEWVPVAKEEPEPA